MERGDENWKSTESGWEEVEGRVAAQSSIGAGGYC